MKGHVKHCICSIQNKESNNMSGNNQSNLHSRRCLRSMTTLIRIRFNALGKQNKGLMCSCDSFNGFTFLVPPKNVQNLAFPLLQTTSNIGSIRTFTSLQCSQPSTLRNHPSQRQRIDRVYPYPESISGSLDYGPDR